MGVRCFAPVGTDRFPRSVMGIGRLPGSKLSEERDHFLDCFSHLKTPVG